MNGSLESKTLAYMADPSMSWLRPDFKIKSIALKDLESASNYNHNS